MSVVEVPDVVSSDEQHYDDGGGEDDCVCHCVYVLMSDDFLKRMWACFPSPFL